MTFNEWLDKNWQKDNMFPPPLNAQLFLENIIQNLNHVSLD